MYRGTAPPLPLDSLATPKDPLPPCENGYSLLVPSLDSLIYGLLSTCCGGSLVLSVWRALITYTDSNRANSSVRLQQST